MEQGRCAFATKQPACHRRRSSRRGYPSAPPDPLSLDRPSSAALPKPECRRWTGSPYLLDGSEEGQKRAKSLLEESDRIEQRERVVEEQFQKQSAEIRRRLDLIRDARIVLENNALELTGLPLSETEAEIERGSAGPRNTQGIRRVKGRKGRPASRRRSWPPRGQPLRSNACKGIRRTGAAASGS